MAAKPNLTDEQRREIVQLRMTGTMTCNSIGEKFGVSGVTVAKIWDKWLSVGEAMFAEDSKKEEPASAATDTSSEEETPCENVSDSIVPDIPENVKGEQETEPAAAVRVPDAVLEACRERIAALRKDIESWQASIDIWNAEINEMQAFIGRSRAT